MEMKIYKDKISNFFKWVKGTELVELDDIDVSEDPVRPELTLGFRITHGRKIFGLKYEDEIEAIVCVAFCPEIPYTVRELDYMSRVGGNIAIAYTVWSRKKGAGREIIQKAVDFIKNKKEIKKVVTLSPLTPMATHFHIRNKAKLISINPTTQNFEYKI